MYPNKLGYIAIVRLVYNSNLGVYMYFCAGMVHFFDVFFVAFVFMPG